MSLAFQSFAEQNYSSSEQLFAGFCSDKEQEAYPGELAELRQQSRQLSQLIDVMPTGLVMLDGNGIVTKINPVASEFLDEPILGQPWFDVIRRSFKPRADDWHEVSLKDGRRVKLEIRPLSNQPGQLIVITDLTQTRLLQDKLSKLKHLSSLGRMVSTLAHQIRTPLSAAILYGANLKSEKLTWLARQHFQDKLMSRLQDLEQQVNDMLLFAKSGNQQVVESVAVNGLVRESVDGLDALIKKAGAKINIGSAIPDVEVLGNRSALSGAIQNLVHNSLELIPSNAIIDINIYQQEQQVCISIQDNGPGISADLKDKIFEPFVTGRDKGTGLGLAVVKSVANAHQGDVLLLSQVDESAHFCICLPMINTAQSAPTPSERELSGGYDE